MEEGLSEDALCDFRHNDFDAISFLLWRNSNISFMNVTFDLFSTTATDPPAPPDPPEDIIGEDLLVQMKLSDVESEDARERLRTSNLDDLEKAFQFEVASESHDGTTSTNDLERFPFIPIVPQAPIIPQAFMSQATGGPNTTSFAPTSQINVPQETNNTFDLSGTPPDSMKRNEEDTIESLVENVEEDESEVEEKKEAEVDRLINETFQNKMSMGGQAKSQPKEKDMEDVNVGGDKGDENQVKNFQAEVKETEKYFKLNTKSSLLPLDEDDDDEEEEKQEIQPILQERSVKFSLPINTTENDVFEKKQPEAEVNYFDRHSQNKNPFPTSNNNYSSLRNQNIIQEEYDRPTRGFNSYDIPTSPQREETKPVIVCCGYEMNLPNSKTCFGFLLIIGAAIGFTVSMMSPPGLPAIKSLLPENNYDPCVASKMTSKGGVFVELNSTIICAEPTVSPAPTQSNNPTMNPTNSRSPTSAPIKPNIYDDAYAAVQQLIVESAVSPLDTLPVQCYLPLCSAGIKEDQTTTLQQKTVHYLLTQDQIFFKWVNNNELFSHAERVLQRYILTLMAFSFNSEEWSLKQNWPVENGFVASTSECDWYGITCGKRPAYVNLQDFVDHTVSAKSDATEREVEATSMVTNIVLRNNTLVGKLPPEVFKLRHLEQLKLHHNKLSGSLPQSIGLLSSMKKLWLHDTKDLSGTIPTTIGNMTSLNSIWIGLNKFSGSIPTEIGKLTNLETIGFLANRFSGTIPLEILKLSNLQSLYLDINELNGPLPELGQLQDLRDLRVDTNNLNGTLPSSLSELRKMKNFYAYKNDFHGKIPNSLVVGWEALG